MFTVCAPRLKFLAPLQKFYCPKKVASIFGALLLAKYFGFLATPKHFLTSPNVKLADVW